jgi:hypothetical protein
MIPSPASETRLREAYETLLRERDPRDRESCPSPEGIAALVERRIAESARLEMLDHVMSCARCRRDLDLVRTATAAAKVSGSVGAHPRFASPRLLALAATVVIAVGVAWFARSSTRGAGGMGEEPVLRGESSLTIHPLLRVPGAEGGTMVSWHPVASARRYELSVSDPSGRSLLTRTVTDTSLLLADSLTRATPLVIVTVSAELVDGSTAGPVSARLATPAP